MGPHDREMFMLDDNSQSVGAWFGQHLEAVITFVVMTAGLVASYVRLGGRVDDNGKDIEALREDHNKLDDEVAAHLGDIRRHIDPERDERRWQELREDIKWIKDKLQR
jgi:hypothetical protein